MFAKTLKLTDFRCYDSLEITFDKGINILRGKNAAGKTTIPESIYTLATSKSFRTSKDAEMIKEGSDFCRAEAEVEKEYDADAKLALVISRKEKKRFTVNGSERAKISEVIGRINAVSFTSADTETLKGEPALRRRFLDLEIGQMSPRYLSSLAGYKRSLRQRNVLIKSFDKNLSRKRELDQWNYVLAKSAAVLVRSRCSFLKRLGEHAAPWHKKLSGLSEDLTLSYKCGISGFDPDMSESECADFFVKKYEESAGDDIFRGHTTSGPHRDDFKVSVNFADVSVYASSGQLKTAAIALKIAEMRLLTDITGEQPIMLLDDITAELDPIRCGAVFDAAGDWQQTIITAASLDREYESRADVIFSVESGKVARL